MGDCNSTSNCNPCGPDFNAINQLASKAAVYARQSNTYSVDAQNAAGAAEEFAQDAADILAAAEDILANFNAIYLGSHPSAPTTTTVGALYFNTTLDKMFVWNGTAWEDIQFNEQTNFLANGTSAARNLATRFTDWANILDYGADPTGATNSQPAIQAAVNSLIATGKPWVLLFPPGDYRIEDEINLDAATRSFAIIGSGRLKTYLKPTAFGCQKAIFAKRTGQNVVYITFKDFSIIPISSSNDDPYGLFFRNSSRLSISNISASSLSNTVIAAGPAFNSDWSNIELFGCGYQPLWKTVSSSIDITTTNGSPTITANSAIFAPSDVGQTVFVSQRDPGVTQPSNSALTAQIITYNSPTSVTLDKDCFVTSTTRKISFDAVKGSILIGTNTLTFNTPCLSPSDVGRIIAIEGGMSGTGQILVSTILNVISNTQCQIAENATATATNRYIWFSPSIYVGQEITPVGQSAVNDLSLNNIQIEQYNGPGLFIDEGTNVNSSILKFHGYDWDITNFSRSREAMIVHGTSRSTFSQTMITFGCVGINSGLFKLTYGNVSTQFQQTTVSAVSHGDCYLIEFTSDDDRCLLSMGSIIADSTDWSKMAGIIKKSGTFGPRKVVSGPYVSSFSTNLERFYAMPPAYAGQFRSIIPAQLQDDEAASFFPDREHGFVLLTSDSVVSNGMFWYSVNGSPALDQVYAGADLNNATGPLNGTTGVNGKATISAANDGKIYIENRLGATRVFTLTFIGG